MSASTDEKLAEAAAMFERLQHEDEQKIRREGYLSKRGGGHKSRKFKKRWFVLRLSVLEYWTDERKKSLKGAIKLNDTSVSFGEGRGQFELHTPHRIFVLMASNDTHRQAWIDAMNEVYEIRRLQLERLSNKNKVNKASQRPKTTPANMLSQMKKDSQRPLHSVPAIAKRTQTKSIEAPIEGLTSDAIEMYTKMAPPPPPPAGSGEEESSDVSVSKANVSTWTVDQVCDWIQSIGCESVVDCLRENEIQGKDLLELTLEELEEDLEISDASLRSRLWNNLQRFTS